jgi:hypothetical protein
VTDQERAAINSWFNAVQAAQPPGTLALLVYVRDGQVILGRGEVPIELRDFPLEDLPQVSELVSEALEVAYHANNLPVVAQ